MKTKEIVLTAEEGQFLLSRAAGTTLPAELGEEKFDIATQSISNGEIADLLKALKAYSPWAQEWGKNRLNLFGDKNDWVIIKDGSKVESIEQLVPDKTYTVKLGTSAVNGAMWILFLSLFPSVKMAGNKDQYTTPVSAATATQICWPIAEKLGKVKALQTYLKIDPNKSRNWADDEFPAQSS